MFPGFDIPEENWSKLPHDFINALPLIETIGEMKVILYILRHTWGFQDESKKITVDEFVKGRKLKDRSRMDAGTGLAKSTVLDGLKRAEAHGFISVEVDDCDGGRIKKIYSLRGIDSIPSETPKSDPRGIDSIPRSEKETLERNLKKDKPLPEAGTISDSDIENSESEIPDVPNPTIPVENSEVPEQSKPVRPPAADVFREETHRWPRKSWWPDLEKKVTSNTASLDRWREVVHAYVGLGWNPMNVKGMLEWFERNEIPCVGRNSNARSTGVKHEAATPSTVRAFEAQRYKYGRTARMEKARADASAKG